MNPFGGESPDNYEQKCLCVLVLDVSGSMDGVPIHQLNNGLQDFHMEVLSDFTASNRLEVSIITFGSVIRCIQEPCLVHHVNMPVLTTGGSTKLADAMKLAIRQVENRKIWYKNTGQNYYRPMIVLITDGEPDPDQDMAGLSREILDGVNSKKFTFYALGVQGYNHAKISQICHPSTPPLPLDGYKFSAFFKWLSNSIGIITKSKEGDKITLPPINGWLQAEV